MAVNCCLICRFDSSKRSWCVGIVVRREVDQAVRTLAHVAYTLADFTEEVFSNFRSIRAQCDAVKLFLVQATDEDVALPFRKLFAGVKEDSGWMDVGVRP